MKGNTLNFGLLSTTIILTLAPTTQAFPSWMKPRHGEAENAPRQYNAYDLPPSAYGGGYSFPGVGPQPTIATSPISHISSVTSESSGEETSSSLPPSVPTTVSYYDPLSTSSSYDESSTLSTAISVTSTNSFNVLSYLFGSLPIASVSPSSTDPVAQYLSTKDASTTAGGAVTSISSALSLVSLPPGPYYYGLLTAASSEEYRSSVLSDGETAASTAEALSSLSSASVLNIPTLIPPASLPPNLYYGGLPPVYSQTPTSFSLNDESSSMAGGAQKTDPLISSSILYDSSGTASSPSSSAFVATSSSSHGDESSISPMYSSPPAMTTVPSLDCHHDNCLRQFIRSSDVAAPFCKRYTAAIVTGSAGLPSFVSQCHDSPSAILSACSCLVSAPTTTTTLGSFAFSTSSVESTPRSKSNSSPTMESSVLSNTGSSLQTWNGASSSTSGGAELKSSVAVYPSPVSSKAQTSTSSIVAYARPSFSVSSLSSGGVQAPSSSIVLYTSPTPHGPQTLQTSNIVNSMHMSSSAFFTSGGAETTSLPGLVYIPPSVSPSSKAVHSPSGDSKTRSKSTRASLLYLKTSTIKTSPTSGRRELTTKVENSITGHSLRTPTSRTIGSSSGSASMTPSQVKSSTPGEAEASSSSVEIDPQSLAIPTISTLSSSLSPISSSSREVIGSSSAIGSSLKSVSSNTITQALTLSTTSLLSSSSGSASELVTTLFSTVEITQTIIETIYDTIPATQSSFVGIGSSDSQALSSSSFITPNSSSVGFLIPEPSGSRSAGITVLTSSGVVTSSIVQSSVPHGMNSSSSLRSGSSAPFAGFFSSSSGGSIYTTPASYSAMFPTSNSTYPPTGTAFLSHLSGSIYITPSFVSESGSTVISPSVGETSSKSSKHHHHATTKARPIYPNEPIYSSGGTWRPNVSGTTSPPFPTESLLSSDGIIGVSTVSIPFATGSIASSSSDPLSHGPSSSISHEVWSLPGNSSSSSKPCASASAILFTATSMGSILVSSSIDLPIQTGSSLISSISGSVGWASWSVISSASATFPVNASTSLYLTGTVALQTSSIISSGLLGNTSAPHVPATGLGGANSAEPYQHSSTTDPAGPTGTRSTHSSQHQNHSTVGPLSSGYASSSVASGGIRSSIASSAPYATTSFSTSSGGPTGTSILSGSSNLIGGSSSFSAGLSTQWNITSMYASAPSGSLSSSSSTLSRLAGMTSISSLLTATSSSPYGTGLSLPSSGVSGGENESPTSGSSTSSVVNFTSFGSPSSPSITSATSFPQLSGTTYTDKYISTSDPATSSAIGASHFSTFITSTGSTSSSSSSWSILPELTSSFSTISTATFGKSGVFASSSSLVSSLNISNAPSYYTLPPTRPCASSATSQAGGVVISSASDNPYALASSITESGDLTTSTPRSEPTPYLPPLPSYGGNGEYDTNDHDLDQGDYEMGLYDGDDGNNDMYGNDDPSAEHGFPPWFESFVEENDLEFDDEFDDDDFDYAEHTGGHGKERHRNSGDERGRGELRYGGQGRSNDY